MDRQPCPHRIYDDLGIGFTMGCVIGGVFHFVKGLKNSPSGQRFNGALVHMRQRGPVMGGNFAVWGGLFSSFECLLIKGTGQENMWTAIASGTLTGGVLAIRGGTGAAVRSAAFGGIFLGLIEGCSHLLTNYAMQQQKLAITVPQPPRKLSGEPQISQVDRTQMRDSEFNFIIGEE
jgi:import inner membrane translocase subunit TIM17